MRSGTSFFNRTVFLKTAGRYWPLWALYSGIWVVLLPLSLLQLLQRGDLLREELAQHLEQRALDFIYLPGGPGVILAFVFSVLCAMAVFGYLFGHRSACMMHALPLRRETLFSTQYLAGLSFLLLPHLAVAGITALTELWLLGGSPVLPSALKILGVWLLAQSALCVFFFSFASFCAMFTGHVLALPAFYGILNFLVFGVCGIVRELMDSFIFGYDSAGRGVVEYYLTPPFVLSHAAQARWVEDSFSTAVQDLPLLGTYALAGLVLAVLAQLVYRTLHVENAGDVVAVPLVRPLFRVGVALCCGVFMGTYTAFFFYHSDSVPALVLAVAAWTAVGYLIAEMLLTKSFRVGRAWRGCLAVTAAAVVLCAVLFTDLPGIARRIPQTEQVARVSVSGDAMGSPYDLREMTFEDPDQIRLIINLHQALVQEHVEERGHTGDWEGTGWVRLSYTMKSGSTMGRAYEYLLYSGERGLPGTVTWALDQLQQDPAAVRTAYGIDDIHIDRWIEETWEGGVYHPERDRDITVMLQGVYDLQQGAYLDTSISGVAWQDLAGLWQAVESDFDAGTLGRRYLFDDREREENTCRTDLVFHYMDRMPDSGRMHYMSFPITLTPEAEHTLDWLTRHAGLGENDIFPTYGEYLASELSQRCPVDDTHEPAAGEITRVELGENDLDPNSSPVHPESSLVPAG